MAEGGDLTFSNRGSTSIAKGRPRSCVEKEKLEYLRSLTFTWEETAALMGTSSKTLQRRAKEWNIPSYSTVSDAQLDEVVSDILMQFPTSGEVMIRGHVQAREVCQYKVLSNINLGLVDP